MQYVQEVRALAEKMNKRKPSLNFQESFTLESKGAAIHGDSIKSSKYKYYNALKEQQLAMKQLYN